MRVAGLGVEQEEACGVCHPTLVRMERMRWKDMRVQYALLQGQMLTRPQTWPLRTRTGGSRLRQQIAMALQMEGPQPAARRTRLQQDVTREESGYLGNATIHQISANHVVLARPPPNPDPVVAILLRRNLTAHQGLLQAGPSRRRRKPAAIGAAMGQRRRQEAILPDRGPRRHQLPNLSREPQIHPQRAMVQHGRQHRGDQSARRETGQGRRHASSADSRRAHCERHWALRAGRGGMIALRDTVSCNLHSC